MSSTAEQPIVRTGNSRTLEAKNIELRDVLAAERQANIGVASKLDAMSASHVISDILAKANRREITDGRAALASSRAETKAGHTDLMASEAALALSRAETYEAQISLVASELVNQTLKLANVLLETNEALLEKRVLEHEAALMLEIDERLLVEETLRQGEKLQAIGLLTAGITHDFGNILQTIGPSLALIGQRCNDPAIGSLVDGGIAAAERAAALVSQLMTFARKEELTPASLDLEKTLATADEMIRFALKADVERFTETAPGTWPILADTHLLEVALLNLAVNARDAMPRGGRLHISARNLTEAQRPEGLVPGKYVAITVRDNGRGMSPEVLARVKEPFFTTKPQGKGTGLGLAMVNDFARLSGGYLRIGSHPGEGTTVEVVLPAATDGKTG